MSSIDIHDPTAPGTATGVGSDDPAPVARAFLRAVTERDTTSAARLLAPNVWLRALLPRRTVEVHTDDDALEVIDGWLGPAERCRVLDVAHHSIEGREHVRYRLAVLPDWAPDHWHVLEQCGHLRVAEGQVTRIDLVCTGYWPVDEP